MIRAPLNIVTTNWLAAQLGSSPLRVREAIKKLKIAPVLKINQTVYYDAAIAEQIEPIATRPRR